MKMQPNIHLSPHLTILPVPLYNHQLTPKDRYRCRMAETVDMNCDNCCETTSEANTQSCRAKRTRPTGLMHLAQGDSSVFVNGNPLKTNNAAGLPGGYLAELGPSDSAN